MQKWPWSFHAEYFWWLKFATPLRFEYNCIFFGSIVVLNSFFFFSAQQHDTTKGACYPELCMVTLSNMIWAAKIPPTVFSTGMTFASSPSPWQQGTGCFAAESRCWWWIIQASAPDAINRGRGRRERRQAVGSKNCMRVEHKRDPIRSHRGAQYCSIFQGVYALQIGDNH